MNRLFSEEQGSEFPRNAVVLVPYSSITCLLTCLLSTSDGLWLVSEKSLLHLRDGQARRMSNPHATADAWKRDVLFVSMRKPTLRSFACSTRWTTIPERKEGQLSSG